LIILPHESIPATLLKQPKIPTKEAGLLNLFLSGGIAMTELRKRMIECLQLRGLSERTQEAYVRAVRQLAEHYHKPPDQITEEELRQYFLYIKNVKHYARNTSTIAICGGPLTLLSPLAPRGRAP
jgi:hypothetical protein